MRAPEITTGELHQEWRRWFKEFLGPKREAAWIHYGHQDRIMEANLLHIRLDSESDPTFGPEVSRWPNAVYVLHDVVRYLPLVHITNPRGGTFSPLPCADYGRSRWPARMFPCRACVEVSVDTFREDMARRLHYRVHENGDGRSDRIDSYLRTLWWRYQRLLMLTHHPSCSGDGPHEGRLDVHHLTYDRLGNEAPGDLAVLCRGCHDRVHAAPRFDR